MILTRLYDTDLAQASYLAADQRTREAIVIDPHRDVERYLAAAAAESLRITHVTETHIHADFISGAAELARRTGAKLLLSGEGAPGWLYAFASREGATLLRDGDRFDVGSLHFECRHTPGHTPEHLSFLLTDRDTADRPVGTFTGDFIFVGDVGRPDLLERAANVKGTMHEMARLLFHSLRRFRELPDYLQLWPGHGAGSACGKALGALPSTTLGYERIGNWAFQIDDEERFIDEALGNQGEPPAYFARMKIVNRDGPPAAPPIAPLARRDPDAVARAISGGAVAVDIRPTKSFAAGHLRGSISIPLGTSLPRWGGTLLSPDRDIVLLDDSDSAARAERARRAFMLIGFDRVTGWGGADVFEAARRDDRVARIPAVAAADAAGATEAQIVDVREQYEWNASHIPDALHAPLGSLAATLDTLSKGRPLIVHCQSGSRAIIAASVLEAHGFSDVSYMPEGVDEWAAAGLPIKHPPSS